MVELYCRRHHSTTQELCEECGRLLDYSLQRIEHCPKGEKKRSCRKCESHCYAPIDKERVKMVMRYVGPRMLIVNPVAAFRHLVWEMK